MSKSKYIYIGTFCLVVFILQIALDKHPALAIGPAVGAVVCFLLAWRLSRKKDGGKYGPHAASLLLLIALSSPFSVRASSNHAHPAPKEPLLTRRNQIQEPQPPRLLRYPRQGAYGCYAGDQDCLNNRAPKRRPKP